MYSLHHRILIVVGLASFATAFNNKFPRATPTLEDYSVNGFTPKPTGDPLLELRKRDPSVCGFASYEPWVSFTCHNGGVCGYNTTVDWWGCCAGQSAGAVTGCAIFTSCVDYTDIGSCAANPECATNSQVVACSNTESAWCATDSLSLGIDTFTTFTNLHCDVSSFVAYWNLVGTLIEGSSAADSAVSSSPSSLASAAVVTKAPTTATTASSSVGSVAGQPPASSTTSAGGAVTRTGAAVVGAAGGMAALVMLFA